MASRSGEILDEDRLVVYRGDAATSRGPASRREPTILIRFHAAGKGSARFFRQNSFGPTPRSVPSALPIPSGPRSAQWSGGTWIG